MSHGGKRPGSGRRKGSESIRRKLTPDQMAKVSEAVKGVIPNAFEGDAYALLASVYKNPDLDLPLRMKAAETAIGYERPKLSAVEMKADVVAQVETNTVDRPPAETREEWLARRRREAASLGSAARAPN